MPAEKEADLGLPLLDLRFLADSNSWEVNGTSNLKSLEHFDIRCIENANNFGRWNKGSGVHTPLMFIGGPRYKGSTTSLLHLCFFLIKYTTFKNLLSV